MNKKLYNLMDWAAIEEVTYGECDHPADILGPHNVGRQTLVQAFLPGALSASLCVVDEKSTKGKSVKEEIKMELADEAGFYAALLSGTGRRDYYFHVEYETADTDEKRRAPKNKKIAKDLRDPYMHRRILTEQEEDRFLSGDDHLAHQYMGAHKKTVDGVRGVVFRVWAPGAVRVALVGDFNDWNALAHPMNRLSSGIHELFLPGIEEGARYQYEILARGGIRLRKADPYSVRQGEDHVSIVTMNSEHRFSDASWLEKRKKAKLFADPIHIFELSLADLPAAEGERYVNIRKVAKEIAANCKKEKYTHVLLFPVMDYPEDATKGFHSSLFFAPDTRYGAPADYMYFVDTMHAAGIGVLLTWSCADFNAYGYGLGSFDGNNLYEPADPKRAFDPRSGKSVFDLGRGEVREYLLSALEHWIDAYHIDGFCTADVAALLYLDYYRNPGEWSPNIYGGVENLEGISFLKEMNALLHGKKSGLLSLASELSGWAHVTGTEDDGLGFDFTTDINMVRELADYLSKDPIERRSWHHELTGSTRYQYCERYLLPISHELRSYIQGGLLNFVNGNEEDRIKNAKLFYGWTMMHIGRKLSDTPEAELEEFAHALNLFYAEHPALYEAEDSEEGFCWISDEKAEANTAAFLRSSAKGGEVLLAVFNFANRSYEKYGVGVEHDGKYEEIFSSDEHAYRTTAAREQKLDGREHSIYIDLAPLSFSIYRLTDYTAEEKKAIREHREQLRKKRAEEERKRKAMAEARAKIREETEKECRRRIAEAEKKIAAGGEYK